MKMLINRIAASSAQPFILDDLKSHIRLSDDFDDAVITKMGYTAAAELEQFAQIALLTQTIRITIFDPDRDSGLWLPIGPVAADNLPIITFDGEVFTAFIFEAGNKPYIKWQMPYYDHHPSRITVEYQAGFGADAANIPHDLTQALMDQAALHYDSQSPMDARSLTTSPHRARAGARFRGVQL